MLSCMHLSLNDFSHPVILHKNKNYIAKRQGKFFVVELSKPHRVMSTSAINGGESSSIKFLINHQSMEASGDNKRFTRQLSLGRKGYHLATAQQLGLPENEIALMGTAANIQQMAQVTKTFKGLEITAFVTAGVRGNAQRAGDPTRWFQTLEGERIKNRPVERRGEKLKRANKLSEDVKNETAKLDYDGTINIILMINKAVAAGAQSKLLMLATEAKSAALNELAVASKVSSHLATGTGTDQLIVASPTSVNEIALPSASGHLKIGELAGATVKEAVLKAIRWQNKLDPVNSGNLIHALERFGLTYSRLSNGLREQLSDESFLLAEKNIQSLTHDARLTSAAYAYAQILDRLQYQALPLSIAPEILRDQAAQAAVAVSGKPSKWPDFWRVLSRDSGNGSVNYFVEVNKELNRVEFANSIDLFIEAIALGWEHKWSN